MWQTGEERPTAVERDALLAAGTPLALASLAQTLIGTLAVAVAGRLGDVALGAVGLGSTLFFTVAMLGVGILLGVDPIVTQALGRGDGATARAVVARGLRLAVLLACSLGVVLLFLAQALGYAGLPTATLDGVRSYLWGRLPGLVPYLAFVVLRSALAARGQARQVLFAALIANVGVLATAPLLARSLGVAGVGLAESAGALLQLGASAWSGRRFLSLAAPSALGSILRSGLPVGLAMVAEYSVFAAMGLLVARLDAGALGAHQVAITWVGTLFVLPHGFGTGALARVGRALGRGAPDAALRSGLVALGIGVVFGVCAGLALLSFPSELAAWVTNDPKAIARSAPLLAVAALALVADSAQAVLVGAVRGTGDTRGALVSCVVGHYALGLPAGVVLAVPVGLGAVGLWLGLSLGLSAVAVLLAVRFIRGVAPVQARASSCESRSPPRSLPAPWRARGCSRHPSLGPVTSRLLP